jgi:hypothetical protein
MHYICRVADNRSAILAAILPIMPALVSARWLNYPTPGVPKKADGTPDLDAPSRKGKAAHDRARASNVHKATIYRLAAS